MTNLTFLEKPCERCGSKKRVSKTWKEKIPTFTGETVVEYSQIVCTNKECQQAFDENLKKETKKRLVLRLEKEEKDKARKANALLQASKFNKSKSRV